MINSTPSSGLAMGLGADQQLSLIAPTWENTNPPGTLDPHISIANQLDDTRRLDGDGTVID